MDENYVSWKAPKSLLHTSFAAFANLKTKSNHFTDLA